MECASSVSRMSKLTGSSSLAIVRWFGQALLVWLVLARCGLAQSEGVQAVDWSRFADIKGVDDGDAFGKSLAVVLQNQSRFLFGWIESQYPIKEDSKGGKVYSFSSGTEGKVRPLAHFAWGNAILLKTGIYDSAVTGVSPGDALRRTELAIRGVAMTHRANNLDTKTAWGQGLKRPRSWQAAYWAAHAAQPAWMLWDSIGAETKEAVAKMVKYEADAFVDYEVPYWKNRDGSSRDPTDTKAEENAWNGCLLSVAQAMLPNDANVARWRKKASELAISAYARQSDLECTTLVDGQPVKQWLKGYNTFSDGVVINHDLAHPGYMACHALSYEAMVDAALAGQRVPQSAFYNDLVTWKAFTEVNFVPGTNPYDAKVKIMPPGGTILHQKADGTPDPVPYFPNGDDWFKNLAADVNFVLLCTYASVRKLDAGQSVKALDWAAVELDALRKLQRRAGHDGNIYQDDDCKANPAFEDVDGYRQLAEAWLIHWLSRHDRLAPIGER
jgi:hypothetical protein